MGVLLFFCNNNIFVSSGVSLGINPKDTATPEAAREGAVCIQVCACVCVRFITIQYGQSSAQGQRPVTCSGAIPYFQEHCCAFSKHRRRGAEKLLKLAEGKQTSSSNFITPFKLFLNRSNLSDARCFWHVSVWDKCYSSLRWVDKVNTYTVLIL